MKTIIDLIDPGALLSIALVLVALFAFAASIASRPRGRQFTPLANVAEGVWHDAKTFSADAAFGARYLIGKLGAAVGGIAICGAADVPFGVVPDECAQGDGVTVQFLGRGPSKLMVASAAITFGDRLVPAANGKVRKLPTAPGTYWIIGTAMSTQGTADQLVEVLDCAPFQVVVES